jgi:hypothetical protein
MAIISSKSQWLTRLMMNHSFRNNQGILSSLKSLQNENIQSRHTSTTSSSKGQSISINNFGVGGILTSNPETNKPKLDLTFEDSKTAFKSKTTLELMRGLLVFQLCSINLLIDNQKTV